MSLQEISASLVHEYEYFTNVLALMDKKYSKTTPTVQVSVKRNKVQLLVNPDFFNLLNKVQQQKLLIHESLHIIHHHLLEKANLTNNIAWDIAINQYCEITPHLQSVGAVTIHSDVFKKDVEVLPNQSWFYYLDLLDSEKIKKYSDFDDHSEFGEEGQAAIKDLLQRAYQNTSMKGRGELSGDLTSIILGTKGKHNWRRELRTIVGNKSTSTEKKTRLKTHKRIGQFSRGSRTLTGLYIVYIVDTSGSMSEDMQAEVFGELSHLYKHKNCTIDIICADTEVQKITRYDGKNSFKSFGGGGTVYQPAIDKAHELGADLTILAGDGGCFDAPQPRNKKPFIWLLNQNCDINVDWGKKIKLE
jgi:predicted metal-dependent peptidase